MVYIVTSANRILFERQLDEMYRFRHSVAVSELGWHLPDAEDGYDIDAFDTDDTIYFLDYAEDGRLLATARLNPTLRPHLMSDVFPEYVDVEVVPRADNIYEYSRYLVTKRGTTQEEFVQARARVLIAVYEFAFANNIAALTVLTYQKNYPIAASLSRTRPLGSPRYCEEDDQHYIAMISSVTQDALDKAYMIARMRGPVGVYNLPLHLTSTLPHAKNKASSLQVQKTGT